MKISPNLNQEKSMMGSTMKKLNSSNEAQVNIGISNSKTQSPVPKISGKEKMVMPIIGSL